MCALVPLSKKFWQLIKKSFKNPSVQKLFEIFKKPKFQVMFRKLRKSFFFDYVRIYVKGPLFLRKFIFCKSESSLKRPFLHVCVRVERQNLARLFILLNGSNGKKLEHLSGNKFFLGQKKSFFT